MKINKMLTKYNQSSRGGNDIRYIVLHYVGGKGSAKDNCIYFRGGNRKASAHFFVDENIYQSVALNMAAWHCGGGEQDGGDRYGGARLLGEVFNSTSVGIEMCCYVKNGRLVPTPNAIKNAKSLVQYLQKLYNIPDHRVIRHFDVTGKQCPLGYTTEKSWKLLHEFVTDKSNENAFYIAKKTLTIYDDPSTKSKKRGTIPNGMIFKAERKWNRTKQGATNKQYWRRYGSNQWVCVKGVKRYADYLG